MKSRENFGIQIIVKLVSHLGRKRSWVLDLTRSGIHGRSRTPANVFSAGRIGWLTGWSLQKKVEV
jgi:hypothetical protein